VLGRVDGLETAASEALLSPVYSWPISHGTCCPKDSVRPPKNHGTHTERLSILKVVFSDLIPIH